MTLAEAQRIIDDPTHPDWLAAYKTIQWNDIWRASPQTLDAELVDVEPAQPGPVVLDDDRDFTFRDAEVSGRYGCDGDAYYVEANSGPGWVRPGAARVVQ